MRSRSNKIARKERHERIFASQEHPIAVNPVGPQKWKRLRTLMRVIGVFFRKTSYRNKMATLGVLSFIMASSILPSFAALNSGSFFDSYEEFIPVEDTFIEELVKNSELIVSSEEGVLANPIIDSEEGNRAGLTGIVEYEVQAGDTLGGIAERFGISVGTIAQVNGVRENATIRVGTKLDIIPVDGVLYEAGKEETLADIVKKYEVELTLVAEQNNLTEKAVLQKGEKVILPGAKPIKAVEPERQTFIAQKPKTTVRNNTPSVQTNTSSVYKEKTFSEQTKRGRSMVWPSASPVITQGYRYGHPALDIAYTKGDHTTAIVAAMGGTVIQAAGGYNGGYGNVVVIDHGNGLQTRYGHMRELYVRAGQQVAQGQAIGWMGRTGRVYGRTGLHLHFEVILNKQRVNPMGYL